ncbi:MAG: OmpH family outer membrane protein [Bacteroidales bacterium]
MNKLILTFAISTFFLVGYTQTFKFAHIDSQALLDAMPQKDSVMKVLEREYKQTENILQEMQVEFNKKYQIYLEKQDSLSPSVKKIREQELMQMQERYENYKNTASTDLQNREGELFKPIMDKAKKAIEEVAKEQGFLYVFDISAGMILFHSDKSTDIMPLVKKKLGITK